jgi:hypothetical protein
LSLLILHLSEEPYDIAGLGGHIAYGISTIFALLLILLVVSQLILFFSIPALLVGIEYLKLKDFEKALPLAVTLLALLLTQKTSLEYNFLFLVSVFASTTILVRNKKKFIK